MVCQTYSCDRKYKNGEFLWQQPAGRRFCSPAIRRKTTPTERFLVSLKTLHQTNRAVSQRLIVAAWSLHLPTGIWQNVCCAKIKWLENRTYDYNKIMSLFRVRCRAGCYCVACERQDEPKWCSANEFVYLFIVWPYASG